MRALRLFLGLSALCACPLAALAQDSGLRFWGGFDLGYASLARSYSVTERTNQGKLTMAFRGGVAINPRLLAGIELGGWTIEGSDLWDPAKGEAIGTRFLVAQYYPVARSAFFVRGGGGRVVYWNNRPGENGANGAGRIVGAGYDIALNATGVLAFLTPSADYSWGGYNGATSPPGVVQDQRYRAFSLRIGFTLR